MSLENILAQNAQAVAAVTGTATQIAPPAVAAAAPPAPPTPAPAAPVPAPAAPAGITLTPDQWAAYTNTQNRIAELEAAEQRRAADAQAAEIKAMQAKGQIEQAFALQRQQAEATVEAERKARKEIEDRAKRYALDGELGRALSNHQLVVGGAQHLTRLLRDEFSVEAQGDSFVVRSKDFRSVGEYIGSMLGTAEYSCFVRAQNPAGGTAGGGSVQSVQTPAAQAAAPAQPQNMSEAVLMQMAALQKTAVDPLRAHSTQLQPDGSVVRHATPGFGLSASVPRVQREAAHR